MLESACKSQLFRETNSEMRIHEQNLMNKHRANLHSSKHLSDLELHVMRAITSLKGESLVQVLLQHGGLLDALEQSSVNSLLVDLALLRHGGLNQST